MRETISWSTEKDSGKNHDEKTFINYPKQVCRTFQKKRFTKFSTVVSPIFHLVMLSNEELVLIWLLQQDVGRRFNDIRNFHFLILTESKQTKIQDFNCVISKRTYVLLVSCKFGSIDQINWQKKIKCNMKSLICTLRLMFNVD